MANHMDPPWPLSARIPGNGVPGFSMELDDGGQHRRNPAVMPAPLDTDPRVLFATRFWDRRRRFSDSASQLQHQTLAAQSHHHLDLRNSNDRQALDIPDHRPRGAPQLPPTPTSTRSVPPPSPRPSPRPSPHHHHPQTQIPNNTHRYTPTPTPTSPKPRPAPHQTPKRAPAQPQPQPRGLLHLPGYNPHPIHPRRPIPIATRREELVDALAHIEAKSGPVTIKGAGHLARPLLLGNNISAGPAVLNHFLDYGERTLLVPSSSSSFLPEKMNQRELVRLESEVFDTEKFSRAGGGGGAGARNLTVVTWSEDGRYGTVTLFEVDVVDGIAGHAPGAVVVGGGGQSGLAARRRHVPPALGMPTRRERERVVAVRPVAAMEDVPRQVLVSMRVDSGIRKAVLQRGKGSEQLRWTAHHTRRGLPCHARLWDVEGGRGVQTATGTGFDDGWGRVTRRSRRRDAQRRERSSLRVEDAKDIIAQQDKAGTDTHHIPPDADGVVATIPQLLALLHASRSIVETASSTPAASHTVETENGESLRAVSLADVPKGTRHRGREVHVVVLVPDGAKWAEERIFWTGDAGALSELRQKKYRDVIDRRRGRTARGKGAYDSDWDVGSMGPLSPLSPPPGPRSARW